MACFKLSVYSGNLGLLQGFWITVLVYKNEGYWNETLKGKLNTV